MATLNLIPLRLGISAQASLSKSMMPILSLAGVIGLLIIVPLRHLSLDTNGLHSALMFVIAGMIAFTMGVYFKWRSGWCTNLCPIHPVEKLYGVAPLATFRNTLCAQCERCTKPCPDSTQSMTPVVTEASRISRVVGHLMIGGFVGFIWGWFQVPDYTDSVTAIQCVTAYLWPIGSALVSIGLYGILYRWIVLTKEGRRSLIKIFATAAVSTYYWFRVPALGGFGMHHGTGMLYDLTHTLPYWSEHLSHLVTTLFFIWFMLIRKHHKTAWMIRPVVKRSKPVVIQKSISPVSQI
jgi:hypothetical protein